MRLRPGWLLALAFAISAAAAHSLAQPAPSPPAASAAPAYDTRALTPQEIADQAIMIKVLADMGKGGPKALEPHLQEIREVLNHAPTRYPRTEVRGEYVIVRADPPELGALTLLALTEAAGEKRSVTAIVGFNTYPIAAFMLASWCNEQRRFDEAIRWTDIGLGLQPDATQLRAEKGFALNQTHRPAEALTVYEQGLKDSFVPRPVQAVLLRGKGYALIDLHRLDEAERAYSESLKLAPDNAIAVNELKFIAQERAKSQPQDARR